MPAEVVDSIEDAALVTCWGRAAVPRSGYGRREILDVPTIEEPMRVVQQITAIARGLLGLGLNDNAVAALARRVALDSMPAARRAVLAALATGEVLTTAGVARAAGVDRKVARFALEELAAVGVVCSDRSDGDEAEEPTGTVTWALAGDDGAIIAHVFAGHSRCGGWDNMWVAIPPPPQIEKGDGEATHVSSHPHPAADQAAAEPAAAVLDDAVHEQPTSCGNPPSALNEGDSTSSCTICGRRLAPLLVEKGHDAHPSCVLGEGA